MILLRQDEKYEEKGMEASQINILLVEDNPADQLLAREIILSANPEVDITVLDDGEKAMNAVEAWSEPNSPDVVFLDLNLPRRNGHEVLECIKNRNPHVRVIVLSGSNSEKDIAKARECGIIDYIIKPIGMKELEETIARVRMHIEPTWA